MEDDSSSRTPLVDRRRFLTALGAVSVTGVAGCGGDDGETTAPTQDPTDTMEPTNTTMEETDPPTTEPSTETEAPTETGTPEQPLEDPAALLEIEEGFLEAGGNTTISGTLTNEYEFPIRNVNVTFDPPGEDWTVSSTGSNSFDTIDSPPGVGSSQEVGWEVTSPADTSGEFTLNGTVSYETTTDDAEVSVSTSLTVLQSGGEIPQDGLEAYFPLDTDTPTNQVTGNEATVIGEPTSGASGILDNAWEFTTNDDVSTVGDAITSEPLPINGEEVTVAAWINHDAIQENYSRIYQVDQEGNAEGNETENGPTNGWGVEFDTATNMIRHQFVADGEFLAKNSNRSPVPCPQDKWVFAVTVVDGPDTLQTSTATETETETSTETENITIYTFDVDGPLDGSPGIGGGEPVRGRSDEASLTLMAADGRDTPGLMDEVRAYSRALSRAEVWELYLATGGSSQ